MDRKKVILLAGALLIAAITAFMARSMFAGAAAPQAAAVIKPVETGPQVLVATKALPVGTIITADALRYQPWPEELIEEAYFIKDGTAPAPAPAPAPAEGAPPPAAPAPGAAPAPDAAAPTPAPTGFSEAATPESLVGTVVRVAITAGQPITKDALVRPGDRGFLAAALGPGMRAVTVSVSELTGVAGFIFPGDRVDLVLTQDVTGTDGPPLKVAETIIRNLRVLATDQRAQTAKDDQGNTIVSKYKLVTLEATPRIAEKITVAQTFGTLNLSLRSLADNAAEFEQALASGQIKLPANATPEQEAMAMRGLAQVPVAGKSTYATGGEVSRFQRSSMPAQTPIAKAREDAATQKVIEKIQKGPVVRVSRGGNVTEVQLDRR